MAHTPKNPTVWIEIPVRDLDKGMAFYGAATGMGFAKTQMGGNPVAVFQSDDPATGVAGNLCVGTPATGGAGPVIHLNVAGTAEDAAARTEAAGGTILSPAIDIPEGRLVYATDPDGNRISLFQDTRG